MTPVPPPCDGGILRGAPDTPGCSSHAKKWVLTASILGSSVAFLEASVINIALPAIQQGLGASVGQMQWIASIYTLCLAALTLAAGSAGDRFGRRRLFVWGLAILAAASVAGGLAAGAAQLIVARAVQGIGAALLVPNSLALLSAGFPKRERGGAIGLWSAFTALTGAVGPILGGLVVDTMTWRGVFFLVVPLALITLAVAILRVPDVRMGAARAQIDWWGTTLATAGLGAVTFGLVTSAEGGLVRLPVLLPVAAGLLFLAAFAWVETRVGSPMIPPRLFRSPTFLGANLLTLVLYLALAGIFFVLPFVLVRVHGYSATATGAAYLPFAMLIGGLSRWASSLGERFGARLPLVLGPLVTGAGFALFALPGTGGSYWTTFFPPMCLVGLGMAVTVAPLTTAVMAAVDEAETGVASGVNNTVARVAGVLGVAAVGVVALAIFGRALSVRLAPLDLTPGVRAVLNAERRTLGDAGMPAGATAAEHRAVEQAVAEALVVSCRWVATLCALLALAGALAAALTVEAAPIRAPADAAVVVSCGHLDFVLDVAPRTRGCEECLRLGERWVHLRMCLTCGYVGCCDSSRRRHATAHFWASRHPIVRSLEHGETWRWCYLDETAV